MVRLSRASKIAKRRREEYIPGAGSRSSDLQATLVYWSSLKLLLSQLTAFLSFDAADLYPFLDAESPSDALGFFPFLGAELLRV